MNSVYDKILGEVMFPGIGQFHYMKEYVSNNIYDYTNITLNGFNTWSRVGTFVHAVNFDIELTWDTTHDQF